MQLDFGSGYSPSKGWATLDFGSSCTFNDINEINDNTVRKIRFRNVLHHIDNIEGLFRTLTSKFTENVKITIIECCKEQFNSNVFLDNLWYRGIIGNSDIFIANQYRDYVSILCKLGYVVCQKSKEKEKETITFRRRTKMEKIKNELEVAGFEFAVAIATQAEIEAGAACGQLAIIHEDK